jgi:hypothetical protein
MMQPGEQLPNAAAAHALHLVHHEGDLRAQRAVLAGRRQGGLHLGVLPDPVLVCSWNSRCTPDSSRASTWDWISWVRPYGRGGDVQFGVEPGDELDSGGVFRLITDRSGDAWAAGPGACGCETARPVH